MRTIGLLGGMSWESTREYYRILNEQARASEGGLSSAPILLHSFNFAPIAKLQAAGEWAALEAQLANAAKGLEAVGAEAILICTNYMHRCADAVSAATSIPLIHIAEAIGARAVAAGHTRLGLLGAEGTMSAPFYREKLEAMGIDVLIPDDAERAFIHNSIFKELCLGNFTDATRARYLAIIDTLKEQGAQGIILGCTEIEQLILPDHTELTLYPSAEIHARAGAEFMLSEKQSPQAA